MARRVPDPDPRQAPLPIEQAIDHASAIDRRILITALRAGREHVGLAFAATIAERERGAVATPVELESIRMAFLIENLVIDRDAQAISAIAPAVPRGSIEYRARVCWGEGAMLAAETHEPAPVDAPRAPAILRDVDGHALYLYRSPPPIAIVRGERERDANTQRARDFLVAAIERGTITRINPHPREDNGHGQQERQRQPKR